jgi:hypothetical protein
VLHYRIQLTHTMYYVDTEMQAGAFVLIDAAAGANLHPVVLDLHLDYVNSVLAKHEEHLQRFVSFIRDKLRGPSRGIQLCGGTAVSNVN